MSASFRHRLLTLILALLAVVPAGVAGEELPIPIVVTADRMTSEEDGAQVTATGNVRITRDGMTLSADTVTYDKKEETAVAEGAVTVERLGDLLRGDRLSIDFGTGRGLITHGYLQMKQGGVRVAGDRIEKSGDREYTADRGTLTMCEADPPAWKFTATDIDVGERYATGSHVVFSVADIPVLYFPYLVVPVSRERQSGLLLPRFGVSSKKGFFLTLPYYLNIAPSQEATVYLDLQTKRGAGTGFDYRYLRPAGGSGSVNGYMIYDLSQDRFRGIIRENHQEYFSPTLSLKSTVELTTDQDFFRDFGDTSGEYNRQYLETNVFLTKNGEFWSLTPQIKYNYDLNSANNTTTLQQLPTISFTGIKRPLFDPLFFSLDSDFTDFYREKGLKGQRLRLLPLLTYYATPAPFLEFSAWGGYQQSVYNTYGAPDDTRTFYGAITTGATLSSTLTRVYDTGPGGVERVRHVLIPELRYSYVDPPAVPPATYSYAFKKYNDLFDFNDRMIDQNMLIWSVTNYLKVRFTTDDGLAEYRELLYLKLSQGYDFRQTGSDLLTSGGEPRRLSDLRLETRISPARELSLTTETRYNFYDSRFTSVDMAAEFRNDNADLASLGYHYASNSWDYLEARLGVHLGRQFLLSYTGRYEIPGSTFLENLISLEYRHQCWGVTFTYLNRPNASSFYVSLSLAGIGSLGRMSAY